jgi:hypothetical protein
LQVWYQAGACGDTENKGSSDGWPTSFALRVCKGLPIKHKALQKGVQEFIGHSDLDDRQTALF